MEATINITTSDNKLIGEAILLEDGFYHLRVLRNDVWNQCTLKYVVDKLEELNGPYNEQLRQYFDAEKQRNL